MPIYCHEAGSDPATCINRQVVGDGDTPAPPPPPPAAVVAEYARQLVQVTVPPPRTSPAGVPQITGLRTWFWLDPDRWRPVTARAELTGVWAQVTATPVEATWTPGDGSPPVTCTGPGRPHPGTRGATTDCGHVYTVAGSYDLQLTVTYAVTWRSSTGETGVQAPFVLTTSLPIDVGQRQVVLS